MSTIPLGPFELEAPIGRGGMGEVWRAVHAVEQVPVAIKVLTREGSRRQQYVECFRNEVLSIAKMHHPGIIELMDHGTISERAARASNGRLVEGSPYLVMELARYGSLGEYRMSLRWPELRAVLLMVLDALAHAHARGVIHRDLKPQNILLGCGEKNAVKLTDFGLAHPIGGDHERDDILEPGWGTPVYMAPEQFRGFWRDYGPWTDLYAVGVMAYELACGRLPFEAENKLDLGRAHIMADIPRVFSSFPTPSGFESWVLRLLQKEPMHRFRRAADATLALAHLSADADGDGPERAKLMTDRFGAVESSMAVEFSEAELSGEVANPTELISGDEITRMIVEDRAVSLERDSAAEVVAHQRTELLDPAADASLAEMSAARLPASVGRGGTGLTPNEVHHAPDSDAWSVLGESMEVGMVPETTIEDHVVPSLISTPPVPISWRRRHHPAVIKPLQNTGLGLFGVREPPLVGRDAERDLMWEAMRQVAYERAPRAVLLRGASGVGKSRLAEWFSSRAHELGSAKVLYARHSPMRTPFDGVIPMLARYFRSAGLSGAELYDRVRHHLERIWVRDERDWSLLSDLLSPDAASVKGRFYSHAERHTVISRYLFYESDERPVLLWFDDVQWGAEALMLRRAIFEYAKERQFPILILMTLREDALDARSLEAHLLDELEHDPLIYQCHISPLTRGESRALVKELLPLDEELTARIERRARGVPLFAIQLLGDLVEGDKLEAGPEGFTLKPGESIDLPDDIHLLWQKRLDRLLSRYGAEQLQCLEIAAALGVEVSLVEWINACKHHSLQFDHVLLDQLFEQALISNTEDGWVFAHGLLRESLERRAREEGRWESLNRACAHMIVALYTPSHREYHARYARHLIEAGELERALEPMLEAARSSMRRSDLHDALSILDERDAILNRLDLPLGDSRQGQGMVLRSKILDEQGHYLEARRWAASVVTDAAKYGWRQLGIEANIQCAWATFHRGATVEAEGLFNEAHRALAVMPEDQHTGFLLRIEMGQARVAQRRGRLEKARELFHSARDRAVILGDQLALATCLNGLGDVSRQAEDFAAARRYAERALTLTEEIGNFVLIADCTNDLAEIERHEGSLNLARAHAERAIDLYESVGSSQSLRVQRNLAFIALGQRQYTEAREIFEKLAERFNLTHDYGQLALVLTGLIPCYAQLGDWEQAEEYLDRARHLLEKTQRFDQDVAFACHRVVEMAARANKDSIALRAAALAGAHAPSKK